MNRLFTYLHAKSRDKKHKLFLQVMRPTATTRILNVGASGVCTGLPDQLEAVYSEPSKITGGGPSFPDVQDYQRSFPEVNALVLDGCALPFADSSFDIVYSNAVLEHLPSQDHVKRFAAEVQRVGKGWFVTTPNFWYPADPHYHLPFLQWLPDSTQQRLVASLGITPYDHIHLLTSAELRKLFPGGTVVGSRVTFCPETLITFRAP
jgi:hypothetical protein